MSILKQYLRNKNQYTSDIIYENNKIVDKNTFNLYNKAMENNTNIVTPIRDISKKKLSNVNNIEHMNNLNDNDSIFSDDYSLNEYNKKNVNTQFLNTQKKFLDDIASDYSPSASPINGCDEESLEGYQEQFSQLKLNHQGIPSTMGGVSSNYKITNNEKVESSRFNREEDGRYGVTSDMTHNDMMPQFKSKSYGFNPDQDIKRQQEWTARMELFTGSDQMPGYDHKTEIKKMFKSEDTMVESVVGMPNFSDYMQSRVIPSQTMNGVKPFQPIMQTPGLNLGYNQRGNTGYQDYYRPLPKTVDELRTVDNPKTSYRLPMNEAGLKYNKGPVIGAYHKQRPDRFYENSYDSMLPTDAPMTGPKLTGKIDVPITNRVTTSERKHVSNAKYQTADKTYQHGEFKSPFKKSLKENGPRNVQYDTKGQIVNQKSYKASDTNRAQTSETKYLGTTDGNKYEQFMVNYINAIPDANPNKGLESQIANATGNKYEQFMVNYINAIPDANPNKGLEAQITNTTGNYQSMPLENFISIIPNANNRNMNNAQQIGNASNHLKSYLYNYINSIPDETLKSILSEKIVIGNAKGNMEQNYLFNNKNATPDINMRNLTENTVFVKPVSNKEQNYIFNYINSTPDTTLRELVNTAWNGMFIQGNFQQAAMFNYKNSVPNVTLKEMTEQIEHLTNLIGNKQQSVFFNYKNSIPDSTLKEQIEVTKNLSGMANQLLHKSQMFNYDDKMKTTLRELIEEMNQLTNVGNQLLNKGQLFNYENAIPEQTMRSMTENTKNITGMKGDYTQQRSRQDANNMLVNTTKEIIAKGRKPTVNKGNRGPTTLFTEYAFNNDNNSVNTVFSGVRTKPIDYFS